MPLYRFKAVSGPGDVVEGEMEAISQVAVLEHLRGQGYMPIRADESDGRAIGEGVGQRLLHQRFVLAVEVTRRLVEHDDGGIFDQHASDRETLLFAAREPVAALTDERVIAVG